MMITKRRSQGPPASVAPLPVLTKAILIQALLLRATQHVLAGGISCVTDKDCKVQLKDLTPGVSVCEDGECTNPFEQGCLKAMGERYGKKNIRVPTAFDTRICNSDDHAAGTEQHWCRKPAYGDILAYDEVRIAPSNWESSVFFSWIYQIVLMELLDVPSTMEHGDGIAGKGSFYDRKSEMVIVQDEHASNLSKTLFVANDLDGDCSQSTEPCAHILPDVWKKIEMNKQARDKLLVPEINGMIQRLGFYVPSFTAIKQPELSTIFGLSNKDLSDDFKTPTTWKEYCDLKSCDSNSVPRKPISREEESKYYVPGEYDGYFRSMAEMGIDCVNDSENCVGNFINLDNSDCRWPSYAEAQLKWNDISLVSRGPSVHNNGYNFDDMKDIWRAALTTKSNVIMWWLYPEPMIEFYENSDAKFHRINFPRPTEECLNYRRKNINHCSNNPMDRLGSDVLASCDYPVERPQKYFSKVLETRHLNTPEELRSPAYTVMNQIEIPTYAMEEVFEEWAKISNDQDVNGSREAVCKWVYDNLETLELYIPATYPRSINETRNISLVYVSYGLGTVAIVAIVLVAIFTYRLRESRPIRYAQVGFLIWMIAGLAFVSISTMTSADPTSTGRCVITEWTVLIGYTIEMAPILVKVQAINKITREARRFRRIQIDSNKLKKYPLLFVTPVVIFLIIWTSVDIPKATNSFSIDKGETGDGNIVDMDTVCDSNSDVWSIMAYLWQALLLFSASVLAFQSRDVMEEVNESQSIGFLVYSHFMFLIFRIVVRALKLSGAILGSLGSSIVSMILSVDILTGIAIYFGPKFYKVATEGSKKKERNNIVDARVILERDSTMYKHSLSESELEAGVSSGGPLRKSDSTSDMSTVARLRKAGVKVIRKPSAVDAPPTKVEVSGISMMSDILDGEDLNQQVINEKEKLSSPVDAFPVTIDEEKTKRRVSLTDKNYNDTGNHGRVASKDVKMEDTKNTESGEDGENAEAEHLLTQKE